MPKRLWALILAGCVQIVGPAFAADPGDAALCDAAAVQAARDMNVPQNVMLAVTRLETGRRSGGALRPWPWAANEGGRAHYFDTEDELRQFVFRRIKAGVSNIDVGCFQINYRWHGQAFSSLAQMTDPGANARYAARFLSQLRAETGDWTAAVGAYHSRTPKYAQRYLNRYAQVAGSIEATGGDARVQTAERGNGYPLLRGTGRASTRGSLVPLGSGGASLLGR